MEEQDQSEKTEEPTPKRIADARRKGNVAKSQEINNWASLLGLIFSLVTLIPWLMYNVNGQIYKFIEGAHQVRLEQHSIQLLFSDLIVDLIKSLGPIMAFFLILGIASTYVQVGNTFSTEKLAPKWSKVSPISGLKRIFGPTALVEFAKGIIKLIVVGVILVIVAVPMLDDLPLFPSFALITSMERIQEVGIVLVFWTLAIMTIVSALDFFYQKYDHKKKLRMTKQEVKDEHKQLEGDPKVKARLANIRQERQRARMMANVANADVVITNPTHYAVALKYDMEVMAAPILLAKGIDDIAMRIREEADKNEVPIVENPPLARAIYATVELDEAIPERLYHAVAEVIGYVFRLKDKLPSDGPLYPPPPDWSLDPQE